MIIKKWNPDKNGVGQGGFDELYPKTKASELYASDGTTSIFDANTKIKAAYLPDLVFGGLKFQHTIASSQVDQNSEIAAEIESVVSSYGIEGAIGSYWIASDTQTWYDASSYQNGGGSNDYAWSIHAPNEEDDAGGTGVLAEAGDWIVITKIVLNSGNDYDVTLGIVNNTYQSATTSSRGVVKLGSNTAQTATANAVSSTTGRTYAIQNNGSGQLVVNVPWSDTNTTYSQATDSTLGLLKVSATANTQTLQSVSTNSSRQYAVQLDSNGVASVNVPWADTNTTYSTATSSALGLIKLGSDTTQTVAAESVSSSTGRTYAVQLNSSDQAVVNVPWVNTNTTYSAGEGLTLTGTQFRETYPVYVSASAPTTSIENAIWFDL